MNNLSNIHAEHDISPEQRKKRDGQRRGKISRFRVVYGVKALLHKPWKLAFVALLGILFALTWHNRNVLTSLLLADFPILTMTPILSGILYALIIVVFMLLLVFLLCVLGIPHRARQIDRAIVDIFKNDVSYSHWPLYIDCQREGNTDLWRYTFYSELVPIETWDAKRTRLVSMLCGYIESIEHGGKRSNDVRYIVVLAGKGAKPPERKTPTDPLFRK